jgi:hypothetical protein
MHLNYQKLIKFLFLHSILLTLSNCGSGFFNPDWSTPAEPNAKERARQNVEEGRGISGGGIFSRGKSNFEFASSNPLWRAALDILEPFVFSTVDYAGGLVITDWYSEDNPEEAVKITVRFLTNEIRADALAVTIHKKECNNLKCTINKIDTDLTFQITDKILRKAAYFASLDEEKLERIQKAKPKGKYKIDK